MKKLFYLFIVLLSFTVQSQDLFGKWKTIDDKTGEAKSVVDIYKVEGKVYGKIIEVFDNSKRDLSCLKCKDDDYNKLVLSLNIINHMEKDEEYYKNGAIVDLQNGKGYRLRLGLTDKDQLEVRGNIGFFFSTQYWIRVE